MLCYVIYLFIYLLIYLFIDLSIDLFIYLFEFYFMFSSEDKGKRKLHAQSDTNKNPLRHSIYRYTVHSPLFSHIFIRFIRSSAKWDTILRLARLACLLASLPACFALA